MPVFLKSAPFELLDDHLRAVSQPAPGLPQARDSMVLESSVLALRQFVSWPPLDSCLGFAEKQPRCRGRRQVDEPESDTHCVELRRRSELA